MADIVWYLVCHSTKKKTRSLLTTRTTADDSSPHGARDDVNPSRLQAPRLWECSPHILRAVDAVWPGFSLQT